MYLGWPQYAIHGTNKPWGIGRRTSSGCIRMYPEDAEELYELVGPGTKVTVVDQPIKFGGIDGELFMEAHPTQQQSDQLEALGRFEPSCPATSWTRCWRPPAIRRRASTGAGSARPSWSAAATRSGSPADAAGAPRQHGAPPGCSRQDRPTLERPVCVDRPSDGSAALLAQRLLHHAVLPLHRHLRVRSRVGGFGGRGRRAVGGLSRPRSAAACAAAASARACSSMARSSRPVCAHADIRTAMPTTIVPTRRPRASILI